MNPRTAGSLLLLSLPLLAACGDKEGADTGSGTGDGGSSDGGSALTSGEGFGIVYAAGKNIGIDGRLPVSATFDAGGVLTAYDASAQETPTIGDCTAVDTATRGGVAIGRWAGGTLGGEFYSGSFDFPADDGFHYGVAAAPQDSGSLGIDGAYSQVVATSATISDASLSPGTVSADALLVAGDSPLMALQITVNQGGEVMTLTTPGYPDTTAAATNTYLGQLSGPVDVVGGPFCSDGGCAGYLRAMLADDGELLVVAWQASKTERISGVVLLSHD